MQEGGKTCHKLHVLGMNDDLWDRAVITIIPLSLDSMDEGGYGGSGSDGGGGTGSSKIDERGPH